MHKKTEQKEDSPFNLLDSDDPVVCSRTSPMTNEELEILAEMRNLKDQARNIKKQLSRILPDWKQWIEKPLKTAIPAEAKTHFENLDELRIKWKEREEAYNEARHRRMVALGHEEP